MQPKFMMLVAAGALIIFAAVVGLHSILAGLPDREPRADAVAQISLEPLQLSARKLSPLVLVGAWEVHSDDPRVGGISGVGIDGSDLVAITDRGVVLRFAKQLEPRMPVSVSDLPSGPGDPRFKTNRDSEALTRSTGGGWWVAFEFAHELWRYDRYFNLALERRRVTHPQLARNKGIEGLAQAGGSLLLFPERGGEALELGSEGLESLPLRSSRRISDAAAIGDERVLMIERQLTLRGFRNALVLLGRAGGELSTIWRKQLPVGPFDNFEAVAAEPTADGQRLWLIADNNYHPPMRTVVMVVDVPGRLLQRR